MSFDKEIVRAASPIVEVVAEVLQQPPKPISGGEFAFLCPWHDDKHPSLDVNPIKDGGVYVCRSCGAEGDVFTFVKDRLGLDFSGALRHLADRAGLSNGNGNGHAPAGSTTARRADAPPRPVRWPQDGVLRFFDYPQADGVLVRKVRYDEADKMRWIHSRDRGQTWFPGMGDADPGLYGIDEAIALARRKQTTAMLVAEGERDARRLLDLGLPAVSPPHGASLTMGDKKWKAVYSDRLKAEGFTRAYLFGDHDAAGHGFNGGIARALIAIGLDARPVLWDATEADKFDVTDFLERHGDGDGRRLLCERVVAVKNGAPWRDTAPPAVASITGPVLVNMADVKPEPVEWLWNKRVPRGKVAAIVGDPGMGKSFLTLEIAARVTTGRAWPDGAAACGIGDVVFLAAEDGLADTVRPRLDAMGADVRRVHVLKAIRVGTDDGERAFSLQTDITHLERAITQTGAVLVVIDPVSSYLGEADSYRDAEVRAVLMPLVALAERTGVAIVVLMHLTKDTKAKALYRGMASIAFIAVPRVVLAVGPDPDEINPYAPGAKRILGNLKQNVCEPAAPWAYRTVDNRVEWIEAREDLRMDVVLAGGSPRDGETRRDVEEWLCGFLADGQFRESTAIEAAAADVHITRDRLFRMRKKVCESKRDGYGAWREMAVPPQAGIPTRTAHRSLTDPVCDLWRKRGRNSHAVNHFIIDCRVCDLWSACDLWRRGYEWRRGAR